MLLAAGLVLIVKGGDFFVAAAVRTAGFLRMPRVVIGSTLVSLTTTSPELAISVMSGFEGESDLAVGNAVGSCICNIGLIIGMTAALKHMDVHLATLRTPLLAMFTFGAALFLATLDLSLQRWQGALLVLLGLAYFAWDFWHHFRDRKPAHVAEAEAIKAVIAKTRWAWFQTRAGTATQFVLGAAIVVLGSRLLVEGAVSVAGRLGIPTMIIGLTVVAIGTSLPEFMTAISSSRKAVSDLALGNVLGANIANLSLVVGAAATIQDATMDRLTQAFNFPAMLVAMLTLLLMLFTGGRVSRREGAILLVLYGSYLAALVAMTMSRKH
jgi:cation:H+ antiporter